MKMPTQRTSPKDRLRYFQWRDATLTAELAIEKNGARKSVLQQARTAARRRERETMNMIRRAEIASAPAVGWTLTVKRQLTADGKIYPVGAAIAPETLGKNLQAFLNSHYVAFAPPGAAAPTACPRDLPPSTPPPPRPKVEIVDDPDVVESWRRTVALMTERCGGNQALARDLLLAHRDASALFLRATKIHCDSEAARRGVVSVSPAI